MALQKVYQKYVPEAIRKSIYAVRAKIMLHAAFPRWDPLAFSDPNVRYMGARLASLKGRYAGKRCFLMGNGPSLTQMDLSLFQNELVWGSNRCDLLFDRIAWRPAFYVAVDKRVVPDISADIERMTGELKQTLFFLPVLFRWHAVVTSAENLYWFAEKNLDEKHAPQGYFSTDLSRLVRGTFTVTVSALQLAVYLGFNPIYLIGCDTNYKVIDTVQFEKGDPNLLISSRDDDPNHFVPNYFGAGRKWHDPKVEHMLLHYEQSRRVCDSLGVQVLNATVGGKLEVFPRVDYRSLF